MHEDDPQDLPSSFLREEMENERVEARRLLIRWTFAFAILFLGVFLALWWSSAAVRFGADRVSDRSVPTYRITGVVVDAATNRPIPWARVEDDPAGNPPFYRTDADQNGAYSLLTLAEPHRLRISAPGYRATAVNVGKRWFVWWPKGEEQYHVRLVVDQ